MMRITSKQLSEMVNRINERLPEGMMQYVLDHNPSYGGYLLYQKMKDCSGLTDTNIRYRVSAKEMYCYLVGITMGMDIRGNK